MLIVVIYDIQTESAGGKDRLRRVAKFCESKGKRVQRSVFECLLDAGQFRQFQNDMNCLINAETDSVRYYNLGNHYETRVIAGKGETAGCYERPLVL